MSHLVNAALFAGLSFLSCGVPASADSLRCQSVNGNVNCAGSSGASCQTVNGKTVCISGHGDVMQSFGNGSPRDQSGKAAEDPGADAPAVKERLEQHGPGGHSMLLERSGTELHLRTDWLSVDRE
jgi:hypothetical protein